MTPPQILSLIYLVGLGVYCLPGTPYIRRPKYDYESAHFYLMILMGLVVPVLAVWTLFFT